MRETEKEQRKNRESEQPMEDIDGKLNHRIALLLQLTSGITIAELEAMPPFGLAVMRRNHLKLCEQLLSLDWQAIARDALTRGNTALADAILGHACDVEDLEAIAEAAASVYADHSDERAWSDLFEALAEAGRLPDDAAEVKS